MKKGWSGAFYRTGWFYRAVMRVAHRFSWHYAPEFGPLEDGRYQRWCHWCGMRETFIKKDSALWNRGLQGIGSGAMRQGQVGGIANRLAKQERKQ